MDFNLHVGDDDGRDCDRCGRHMSASETYCIECGEENPWALSNYGGPLLAVTAVLGVLLALSATGDLGPAAKSLADFLQGFGL